MDTGSLLAALGCDPSQSMVLKAYPGDHRPCKELWPEIRQRC